MSADPQSPDRQDYFRIEDRIGLEYHPLPDGDRAVTDPFPNDPLDGLKHELKRLDQEFRSQLPLLAERDRTIDQLLTDYDTVATAIAGRDAQIGQMVDNLVAIAGTFAEHDDLLDRSLVELAQLSAGLDGILDQSAADLGASIDHLAVLTGTAAAHVDDLERALQGLPTVFEELLTAVDRGEWLRVSVLCVTVLPGPCPLPTSVSGAPGQDPIIFDPGSILGSLLDELLGVVG